MSATDSVLFVALLVGALSSIFILFCLVADVVLPWLAGERRYRPGSQATYRRRHP